MYNNSKMERFSFVGHKVFGFTYFQVRPLQSQVKSKKENEADRTFSNFDRQDLAAQGATDSNSATG
jgi:hypothetical protein